MGRRVFLGFGLAVRGEGAQGMSHDLECDSKVARLRGFVGMFHGANSFLARAANGG